MAAVRKSLSRNDPLGRKKSGGLLLCENRSETETGSVVGPLGRKKSGGLLLCEDRSETETGSVVHSCVTIYYMS